MSGVSRGESLALREAADLRREVKALKRDARRWFTEDGEEELPAEQVIEQRKAAAKGFVVLQQLVEAAAAGDYVVGSSLKQCFFCERNEMRPHEVDCDAAKALGLETTP